MNRRELAERYFVEGYNCTQATVLAFEDMFDIPREQLLRISSSFGGGMGRLREVCGAVSGMFFVAGAITGYSEPGDVQQKAKHYATIQALAAKFRETHGSIICRELLGAKLASTDPTPEARTPEYYKTRPCARLAGDCAQILCEYFDIPDKQ